MNTSIMVVVVMSLVGVIFGLILSIANKMFYVEMNPLIHIVEDILPKGQCGACGFAGCLAYAEAVVLNPDVAPNLCIPGKAEVADKVAELTGKSSDIMEPRVAHLKCAGDLSKAVRRYTYEGIEDCTAASLLHGGPKGCQYGCLGFGSCIKHCQFGAIKLSKEGLPEINEDLCTGCGKCVTACPKKVIQLKKIGTIVNVNCNSMDKGASVRKKCEAVCLGCGICSKACPHNAIKIENNLASIDASICIELCKDPVCVTKCPTEAITVQKRRK